MLFRSVLRKQSKEKLEFIILEVDKLIEAGVIWAIPHPTWVANPVVVLKPMTFKWRLCIDLTDLNEACPKDPFPLPRIDLIIDSKAGCELLCFLDAFSRYHQIMMAEEDQKKTAYEILRSDWSSDVCSSDLSCASKARRNWSSSS